MRNISLFIFTLISILRRIGKLKAILTRFQGITYHYEKCKLKIVVTRIEEGYSYFKQNRLTFFKIVPMVLNPHGIEPTFLKFDSWSPRLGFIPIITYNVFNQIKKESKKKISFMYTKNI